jgi:hypothetical protein
VLAPPRSCPARWVTPRGAVADTLEQFRRQRWTERVPAWQLASGAEYALRSRLTLTGYQIDIMQDLESASGARTIEELAADSGDDEEMIADTIDWLARNGYVQSVSACRRSSDTRFEPPPAAAPYDTDPIGIPRQEPAAMPDPEPAPRSRRRVPNWVLRRQ